MMKTMTTALALLFATSTAFAQEEIASEELEKKTMEEPKKEGDKPPEDGWKVKGNLGFSGSLTNAQNFVGAEEGTTVQLGVLLGISADWTSGQHGWENSLKAQHAQTKTPALSSFVKSADQLDLLSTYTYRFNNPEWLGVFGRFKLNTQILRAQSVRAGDTNYVTPEAPMGVVQPSETKVRLTGPFEPLILRESAGAFAKPIQQDNIKVKTSLGLAAQHIITRDGRVIASVDEGTAPPTVTLQDLDGTNDFGIEITANAEGILVKEILTWKLSLDLFQPVLPGPKEDDPATPEDDSGPSGFGRLNLDLNAGLSLKLAKWLSLDYLLTVRRVPVVLREFQVQNQLILTAGFDIL
ncbi:MAG: hypothetical protein RIT81_28025 [Deltaproteobacteria bacterium]